MNSSRPNIQQYQSVAPENFSIINNPEETVSYFNNTIDRISNSKFGISVYFNIGHIKSLTIDSIMYLLAILKNIKKHPLKFYDFSGNTPSYNGTNEILEESGFFDYVHSKNKSKLEKDSEGIAIRSGKYINQDVAKEICDFVNQKFGTDKIYTKFIYNMVIELMTNTIQHAYNDNNCMINYWYIYVKYVGSAIQFIFLDTGSGIPQTITKKFFENVFLRKENEYIVSALNGEYRTKTKLGYRGKGLPKIYQYYRSGIIRKLVIISGKGYCRLDKATYDISNALNGTLFYWELRKEEA